MVVGVTHGNGQNRWIPEESFLVSDENGNIKKDSSGIATLRNTTVGYRFVVVPKRDSYSRQPTAIQTKDSFGIVVTFGLDGI